MLKYCYFIPIFDLLCQLYFTRVGLCFYTALASSVANVVSTQCYKMNVTPSQIMLVRGFSLFLLSLISTFFLPNRLLLNPQDIPLREALFLPVCAVMVMMASWMMTLAIDITRQPTLVTVLRSTEILISIITESLWWGKIPNTLSILGSQLVTLCVFGLIIKEDLERMAKYFNDKLKSCFASKMDSVEPA